MKKILVLGGSYLQSNFAEVAVELGHNVHVLDKDPGCYLAKCDSIIFHHVDISNVNSVRDYFNKGHFDIILSPVTEIGNKVAAIVANENDLPYNTHDTVLATTNKSIMRKKLENSKLDEPLVITLNSNIDLSKMVIPYPCIVKPAVNSASRGVSLVHNQEQLLKAVKLALTHSKGLSGVVIEEYIVGNQYSIETISSFGKHYTVAIVREHLSAAPHFMERMDVVDFEENSLLYPSVQLFVDELLNSLDIQFGPCHIEVKINSEGIIRLIEVASRSGLLRDRLIKAAGGVCYNELIIKAYSGEKISKPFLPRTNAMLGIIAYEEDMVAYEKAKANGDVCQEYFNGNKFTEKPTMLTDAIGYFFLKNDDKRSFENYKMKC
jgi:predicted ATP-grasp superfamily ATP-dependent carboligase